MRNWDQHDETLHCSSDADREDAKFICHKLGIEFCELNFVKEYWQRVFMPLVDAYTRGLTPNPDILCNSFVKFQMLAKTTLKPELRSVFSSDSLGITSVDADAFATGHYAQNSFGNFLERRLSRPESEMPLLLRSADPVKDQTFWLCTVAAKYLQCAMFPVGKLTKPVVKEIAREIGLDKIVARRESMGICFIGKRKFRDFIDNYIEPRPGIFKDYETGEVLGEHSGVHHFTLGQRVPGITKGQVPFYIAKLIASSQEILVVRGATHPALFMRLCLTEPPIWVSGYAPKLPSSDYAFQWQNKWRAVPALIAPISDSSGLSICLEKPMRCVASGQHAALYHRNVCLGGAVIRKSISLAEEGLTEPYTGWCVSDYELGYKTTN
ncbi:unnamed protein product [Schistocephalus solidus]|uniref:tRNA-5-taurinomethyluridine 2-sulfurtransferase n=1 Tax=Schistocephalus solidus TaxID=70667 RepID=A0A183THE0_SCHSO|nr:unnamed protein product [Schistocephalus solidus]